MSCSALSDAVPDQDVMGVTMLFAATAFTALLYSLRNRVRAETRHNGALLRLWRSVYHAADIHPDSCG